jgi:hypothetical protein
MLLAAAKAVTNLAALTALLKQCHDTNRERVMAAFYEALVTQSLAIIASSHSRALRS